MPAKAIITSFCLVLMVAFTVHLASLAMPLAKKADINLICSEYLSKMESMNGLPREDRQELVARLESAGYSNVVVTGTESAKKGDRLTLSVSVCLHYRGISGLFTGTAKEMEIRYEKSSVARKIYN